MKTALITGITGQDGSYLSDFLLQKGYEVHGLRRRTSLPNTERIKHLIQQPQDSNNNFYLHYGDMSDSASINKIISLIQPDEIYNLAAQSHVHVSFSAAEYTTDVNALGTLRILDSIIANKLEGKTRFYQASTSELYGKIQEPRQNEKTPFYPRSPYATAKLYAYWATINYRESYNLFASNGILFNHESMVRGESFLTRKVTSHISQLCFNLIECLYLGNLDAERDWGHAKDYVEAQWLILQHAIPDDFVIASGKKISVRTFVELSFKALGIKIEWRGHDLNEHAIVSDIDEALLSSKTKMKQCFIKVGQVVVKIDPYYFRPNEVDVLWGDATKAENELGWTPKISLEEMIKEMIDNDMILSKNRYKLLE